MLKKVSFAGLCLVLGLQAMLADMLLQPEPPTELWAGKPVVVVEPV